MGLFGKIKEILFDEETVEIPVITKEEKVEEKQPVKSKVKEGISRVKKNDDDVIIKKIETPKRENIKNDDLMFDMPKFKEEVKEEKKANSFSFPVFGDDEVKEPRRERRSNKSVEKVDLKEEETPRRVNTPTKKATGFTNAYDYSYGKYKGDYKTSRESNQAVLEHTLEKKEEHGAFTPSPIISPVFGVLNENYKKEDIVNKKVSYKRDNEALDLDSVRKKAYGTLEDDIERVLDQSNEILEEPEVEEIIEDDFDDEEGISINDLLVDSTEDDVIDAIDDQTEIELFNVVNNEEEPEITEIESQEEIDLGDEEIEMPIKTEKVEENPKKEVNKEKKVIKQEKKDDVEKENLGEEDLFDLIDSLYDGKDEE